MSAWRLTKKLKETHLSSAFGNRPPSASVETLTEQKSPFSFSLPQVSVGRQSSDLRTSTDQQRAGDHKDAKDHPLPPAEVPAPTHTANHNKSASKTLTNESIPSPAHTVSSRTEGSTISSATENAEHSGSALLQEANGTDLSKSSTSTEQPGLLAVTIGAAQGLSLPPGCSYRESAQNDSTSQKSPPVHLVLEFDKTQIILNASSGTIENPVWDTSVNFDISRAISLTAQVYARIPASAVDPTVASTPFSPTSSSVSGTPGNKAGKSPKYEEVFMGSCRTNVDDLKSAKSLLLPLSSGTGTLRVGLQITKSQKKLTINDFELLKVVGKGSFGKVMQVRKKDTQRIYALKTIRKAYIVSRSEVNHTLAERIVLAQIDNPFIVPLKFSFQSKEKLYFVLAFINGGELFHHLQMSGVFDLNRARFYTAELLCALECLHDYNVIYRDLKPENILLDYTGHIALCDFGLCKLNMKDKEKTNTFCGTPEYLAPELLLAKGYTKVVDWWTLGILFYEMLTGLPPFYDENQQEMYKKILQQPLHFPDHMDREARSLLIGLLNRDPKRRLGVNGAAEIKSHPFFERIDWRRLLNKKYAAPFKPAVLSETDTSNFDEAFTKEEPADSVVNASEYLSDSVQEQFGGWTYTNTDSQLAGGDRW